MEHIAKMKSTLQNFMKESAKAKDEIKKNNETFLPASAEPANAQVRANLAEKKAAAKAGIENATAAGKAKAEAWARMDGSKIPEDAKLLQYSMTPEQFTELTERHKGNGTMIHLLQQYGEEQNAKNGASLYNHPEKRFAVEGLPTKEKKLEAYEKFGNAAVVLLSSIEAHPELPGIIDQVENFGVRYPGTPSPLLDMIE